MMLRVLKDVPQSILLQKEGSSPSLSWLCNEVGIGILLIHDMVSLILVLDSFSPSHQPFKDIREVLLLFGDILLNTAAAVYQNDM